MESTEYIRYLWELYVSETATPEQVDELFALISDPANDASHLQWYRQALQTFSLSAPSPADEKTIAAAWEGVLEKRRQAEEEQMQSAPPVLQETFVDPEKAPVRMLHRSRRWWAAAAVLLAVGAGGYWWWREGNVDETAPAYAKASVDKADRAGKTDRNEAILVLSDGRELALDRQQEGRIATEQGSRLLLQKGLLTYEAAAAQPAGKIAWNTMRTPKGRQFQLLLPDGSKVWLNAASSISFPVAFTGTERHVEISGEVYFEIASQPSLPAFRVTVLDQAGKPGSTRIDVLGTDFNVNAYADEPAIHTTVLNGAVRVSAGNAGTAASSPAAAVLKAGQQAQVALPGASSSAIRVLKQADIEQVMAWKNGWFNFQDGSLVTVMRQLARWYDIEVVYEKGIPDIHFVGELSRDLSLPELVKALEESKVHLRLENNGKKLVVLP